MHDDTLMTTQGRQNLRLLPAVERVLNLPDVAALSTTHGRAAVTDWVRHVLAELRAATGVSLPGCATALQALAVGRVADVARAASAQRLRRVINGTGIVIHTNLGRAPLTPAAIAAVAQAGHW